MGSSSVALLGLSLLEAGSVVSSAGPLDFSLQYMRYMSSWMSLGVVHVTTFYRAYTAGIVLHGAVAGISRVLYMQVSDQSQIQQ